MSESYVIKLGGSSMYAPERAAEIFMSDPSHRVAVVSAVGKDPNGGCDGIKGTDLLEALEQAVDSGNRLDVAENQEAFIEKNLKAYSMLGERVLSQICSETYELLSPTQRPQGFKWIGEHISARLFAELTDSVYLPSDLRFSGGDLRINKSVQAIHKNVVPTLQSGRRVVAEGYFGFDISSGDVTTLPRGGSDTSGVVYTGALNKSHGKWINKNYTDKDGILSADPRIIPEGTHVIPEMTHEEVREKMHGINERNGVIHGDAIAYAARLDVDILVQNTFNPSAVGTRIVSSRQSDPARPIIGISGKSNITAIDTFDMGMAEAESYVARILNQAGKQGISFSSMPQAEDRLKLVINSQAGRKDLQAVCDYIKTNAISGGQAKVETIRDEGAVYLVGQELADPPTYTRMLGTVATLLAREGLSIHDVISHKKSPSLALSVAGNEVPQIIQVLHAELIKNR
ncbi:MAG: hypothetical protein ACR2FM_03645 [Candidatus Saccharimonadales bacterium]